MIARLNEKERQQQQQQTRTYLEQEMAQWRGEEGGVERRPSW
jgi:hypothetical protein